jgi:hypothetical protein
MKALKIIAVIFLAAFILGRIADLVPHAPPAPAASTSSPVAQEPSGIFCTVVVDTDDYHDSVCKNTLGFGTDYTETTLSTSGASTERISKEIYERRIAWRECHDQAEIDHPKWRNGGSEFAALQKAEDACK